MADTKLYDVLGVSRNSSDVEIKKVTLEQFYFLSFLFLFIFL